MKPNRTINVQKFLGPFSQSWMYLCPIMRVTTKHVGTAAKNEDIFI